MNCCETQQLKAVSSNPGASNGGKLHFARMQKIILQNQRERLQAQKP